MAQTRKDFGYSRTVSYANSNHWSVITQRWGSVSGKVLPFCAANILLAVTLVWLRQNQGIDLSISEFGHEFMGILVAFLVVNKLAFTLGLYYELQGHLSKMNQSAVELTQLICAFTGNYPQQEYREWRFQVALQALTLLKGTVCVFYKGNEEKLWESPDFQHVSREMVFDSYPHASVLDTTSCPQNIYTWGHELPSDRNLRVPIRLAQRLRHEILKHKSLSVDPLDTIQEQTLLNCVKDFMDSFYGIRKYATCPLPLPLVQLGRIFVIFYVFTLPFALLSPELHLSYPQMMVLVGLTTYGFMGIELLYVEIDDPFSDDPNDLPLTEEARAAGEDICLSLLYMDGRDAADRLVKSLDMNRFNGTEVVRKMSVCRAQTSNGIQHETNPLL